MYPRQSPAPTSGSTERCPVCYLYLLPNMTLEDHLDTHPKDQVIRVLTKFMHQNNYQTISRTQSPWPVQSTNNQQLQEHTEIQNNFNSSWISERVGTSPNSGNRWVEGTQPVTSWATTTYRTHSPSSNWSTRAESSNSRWQNPRPVALCSNNVLDQNYNSGNLISSVDRRILACSETVNSDVATIETTSMVTDKRVQIQVLDNIPYENTNNVQALDLGITHTKHTQNIRINKELPSRLNNSNNIDIIDNQCSFSNNYVINDNSDLRTVNLDDIKPLSLICRKPVAEGSPKKIACLNTETTSNENTSSINVDVEVIDSSKENDKTNEEIDLNGALEESTFIKTVKEQIISPDLINADNNSDSISSTPSSSSTKVRKLGEKTSYVKRPIKKLKIKLKPVSKNSIDKSVVRVNSSDKSTIKSDDIENSDFNNDYLTQNVQSSGEENHQNQQCTDDFYNIEQRTNVFSPNFVFTEMQDSSNPLDNSKDILNLDEFKKKMEENRYNEFEQNVTQHTTDFPNFKEQNFDFVQNQIENTIKIISVESIDDNLKHNELPSIETSFENHSKDYESVNKRMQDDAFQQSFRTLDDSPVQNATPEIKIISVQSIEQFNITTVAEPSDKEYSAALDYTYQFPNFGNGLYSEMANNDEFRQNLDHSSSYESLNIRTDEKMPARGELSEQESTDSSNWAFQNTGTSLFTSMPLGTNDINISHFLSPILEPSSSSINYVESEIQTKVARVKEYRCPHCDENFLCAKERRVHVSREHPEQKSIFHLKKSGSETLCTKDKNKTDIAVSSEAETKSEVVNSTCDGAEIKHVNLENFESGSDYKNLFKGDFILSGTSDFENKPDVNDIKSIIEQNKRSSPTYKQKIVGGKIDAKIIGAKAIRDRIKRKKCNICNEEFKLISKFEEHLKIHPLECEICGKIFHKRMGFQAHRLRHLGVKSQFPCSFCKKRFSSNQTRKDHENIHNNISPLPCDLCDKKFKRFSNLSQHRKFVHLNVKRPTRVFFCHCGENFPSPAKLKYHKETHDPKPKNCKYCGQKFIHIISLNRHLRVSHNDKMVENTVPCVVCAKNLTRTSFKMHMKTHSATETFSCYICNKTFSTKWNLKQHKFIHQNRGSKPHKCHLCAAAFLRETDYKFHLNSHRKIYSYVCNFCGRRFIRKYNYLRHVKEHTAEKKYICTRPDCGKSFHRKYYLTEHIRIHTGVRPYVCSICAKTSTTKSNHNKHLKIHHATTRDTVNLEN